jgi:general secretion pathway protein D
VNLRAVSAIAIVAASFPHPADAALISALRVDATPSGGARITVGFAGPPPAYRIFGTGSSEITLELAQTQAAPSVPSNVQSTGAVLAVRYGALGPQAQIAVRLAAPTPIRVTADARNIYIDVSPVAAAAPVRTPPPAPAKTVAAGDVIEVVPLKYADVGEVVGILVAGQTLPSNDTFAPQPSALGQPANYGGSFGGTSFGGAPAQQQPPPSFVNGGQPQSLGQKITDTIAIDRRLNAVILSGPPAVVAALRATIDKIDVALPSVLFETQIVELTDTAAKAVGIDYTDTAGRLATAALSSKSLNSTQSALSLQAQIYDVVSHGGGRLIARPRVVAQNGASASILTGDAIPIVTTITSYGSATVSQQQVQYVQVGVNLQIQPRISSDGYVTAHVFSEVSSVTGYTQGYPQISQRTATTSATVRDGEAFVIGGLVQENELRNMAKIPGVGDLPLIGSLFRNRTESKVSTNLYIVVTPHVVQRAPAP